MWDTLIQQSFFIVVRSSICFVLLQYEDAGNTFFVSDGRLVDGHFVILIQCEHIAVKKFLFYWVNAELNIFVVSRETLVIGIIAIFNADVKNIVSHSDTYKIANYVYIYILNIFFQLRMRIRAELANITCCV